MAYLQLLVKKTFIQNRWREYCDSKQKTNSQQDTNNQYARITINGVTFIDFNNDNQINLCDKYEFQGKTGFINLY